MDRREFLRRALSIAPAAIILPPAVSYFLAPPGGWPRPLTATEIVNRALRQIGETSGFGLIERDVWERAYEDMMVYGSSAVRVTPRPDLFGAPVQVALIEPRDWVTLEV